MPQVKKSIKVVGVASVAGVAAIATGIGVSQAMADTTTPSSTSTSGTATPGTTTPGTTTPQRQNGGRWGVGHGRGKGMNLVGLAAELGVDQSKLDTAIRTAWQSLRATATPNENGTKTPPTAAERAARQQAFAAALAKQLGIPQAQVTAAIAKIEAATKTVRLDALTARLDAAVKAGTLSAADKASVLKALEAGVLGGGR